MNRNAGPGDWFDLTHPVHAGMPSWEDAEPALIRTVCEIGPDCPVRVSHLSMGVHTGTHLDAPAHYLEGGGMVEDLSLEDLVGPAWVVETGSAGLVDAALLDKLEIPTEAVRLLFRTSNTSRNLMAKPRFDRSYVGLDESGARWVTSRGIRLVGFDYLSVQAFEASDETHRVMLREGIVLVEGLDMSRLGGGWYELICLPFLGKGLEGSPVRAVARPAAFLAQRPPPPERR
jgi:arylformamidase